MPDLTAMLADGLAHHRAGAADAAARAYRTVLSAEPDQPRALYLYGLLLLSGAEAADGDAMLQRAAVLMPEHAECRLARANARHRAGDTATATALWHEVLALRPGHVAASLNLAGHLRARGDWWAAADLCRNALRLHPRRAELWLGLAAALLVGGLAEAAVSAAAAAIDLDDHLAEAWLLHGTALGGLHDPAAAQASLRRALSLDPECARAELHLGNVLVDQDRLDEAEPHLRRAVTLDPALAEAQTSLGFLLCCQGRLAEAVARHDRAVALRPGFHEAHGNRAAALLRAGDFARGFAAYEGRKRDPLHAHCYWDPGSKDAGGDRPEWRGESLAGRTILVFCEQGLGDTIMCARFLPMLAAQGGAIIVVCAVPLLRLLATMPGVVALVARADPHSGARLAAGVTVPGHDTWIDQMSLPLVLGLMPDRIPGAGGYLSAGETARRAWDRRLPAGTRVGLVWAGNPLHTNDRRRSMGWEQMASLPAAAPDVAFISVQLGHAGASLASVWDAAPGLHDLADTAACLANLDLLIAVDTAVAHLAAALGRPVWLLLPYAAEWRWMTGRDDSPWYATMRLFRQRAPGDWSGVVADVIAALGTWLATRHVDAA